VISPSSDSPSFEPSVGSEAIVPIVASSRVLTELPLFAPRSRESEALRGASAVSAWSAVLERDRMLGRREASGAVWGRYAEVDRESWLVDEDEGDGALAVRLLMPAGVHVGEGTRVVIWGAFWAENGVWRFKVEKIARLETRHGGPLPLLPPGLHPHTRSPAPIGAKVIGANISAPSWLIFEVVEGPLKMGDGWLAVAPGTAATWRVARRSGKGQMVAARLFLPGERLIFGGQELLSREERWALRVGRSYVVWVEPPRGGRRTTAGLTQWRARSLPTEVVR
jgi:hypothetical protein